VQLHITFTFSQVFKSEELASFTPYRRGRIFERVILPIPSYLSSSLPLNIAAVALSPVFDSIFASKDGLSLIVEDILHVGLMEGAEGAALSLEWEANPVSDMAADCAAGYFFLPFIIFTIIFDLGPL